MPDVITVEVLARAKQFPVAPNKWTMVVGWGQHDLRLTPNDWLYNRFSARNGSWDSKTKSERSSIRSFF